MPANLQRLMYVLWHQHSGTRKTMNHPVAHTKILSLLPIHVRFLSFGWPSIIVHQTHVNWTMCGADAYNGDNRTTLVNSGPSAENKHLYVPESPIPVSKCFSPYDKGMVSQGPILNVGSSAFLWWTDSHLQEYHHQCRFLNRWQIITLTITLFNDWCTHCDNITLPHLPLGITSLCNYCLFSSNQYM